MESERETNHTEDKWSIDGSVFENKWTTFLYLVGLGREIPTGKQYVENKDTKGYVYFFKYKLQKKGDWLMGIAGIQPKESGKVNSNKTLISVTNKKIKTDESEQKQFERKTQQLLLGKRKSAAQFYYDWQFRNDSIMGF